MNIIDALERECPPTWKHKDAEGLVDVLRGLAISKKMSYMEQKEIIFEAGHVAATLEKMGYEWIDYFQMWIGPKDFFLSSSSKGNMQRVLVSELWNLENPPLIGEYIQSEARHNLRKIIIYFGEVEAIFEKVETLGKRKNIWRRIS